MTPAVLGPRDRGQQRDRSEPPDLLVANGSGRINLARSAERILASLAANPQGQISPSVYETARLVSIAPRLVGHSARIEFLAKSQLPDGSWVRPDGYGLTATCSAVAALLDARARGDAEAAAVDATVVERGLVALDRLIQRLGPADLPDTPAIEVIVPALLERLEQLGRRPPELAGLPELAGPARTRLAEARSALASVSAPPTKLLHSLELLAPLPAGVRRWPLSTARNIGASPAATAAWLATPEPADQQGDGGTDALLRGYLTEAMTIGGGPVPSVLPITWFERAWVLDSLGSTALAVAAPQRLFTELAAAIGPRGLPGGSGLPADADTTSVALAVLARSGRLIDLDPLAEFWAQDHFCTWSQERTASVSTNAHVLTALGCGAVSLADRHRARRAQVVEWLIGQQQPAGHWVDKWHASPLYPTAACVSALGPYPQATSAVVAAADWALATQRSDGSWGRWGATREETGYGLGILVDALRYHRRGTTVTPGRRLALLRSSIKSALAYLDRADRAEAPSFDPLWHDKDLYCPTAVVAAGIVAAIDRGRRVFDTAAWASPHNARRIPVQRTRQQATASTPMAL